MSIKQSKNFVVNVCAAIMALGWQSLILKMEAVSYINSVLYL